MSLLLKFGETVVMGYFCGHKAYVTWLPPPQQQEEARWRLSMTYVHMVEHIGTQTSEWRPNIGRPMDLPTFTID